MALEHKLFEWKQTIKQNIQNKTPYKIVIPERQNNVFVPKNQNFIKDICKIKYFGFIP